MKSSTPLSPRKSRNLSSTEKESDSDVSDGESTQSDSERQSESETNKLGQSVSKKQENINIISPIIFCSILIITILGINCSRGLNNTEESVKPKITDLQKEFPTQSIDLWASLESGVNNTIRRNRPSTFILLYQEKSKDIIENLLKSISEYVTCFLTSCEQVPVILTDKNLNSKEVLKDYGIIIDEYREPLEKSGIMIVKNLENVPGVSAQAFHSFCDEFNPAVAKSVIIFTMKVQEFHRNNMKFLEEYFQKKWTDIKSDAFDALFTRISSMVLEINSNDEIL